MFEDFTVIPPSSTDIRREETHKECLLELSKESGGRVVINADEFKIRNRVICDELDRLIQETEELKQTVSKLEDIVTALWYMPNGPGFETARASFKQSSNYPDQKSHLQQTSS